MTPFSSHSLVSRPPTFAFGSKLAWAGLVGDQFDGGDQADAADLAHQRMIGETAAQFGLHVRADRADMGADFHFVVDLQRLDRDGGGDRMAGVGEAVAEGADGMAFLGQRLEDEVVHHHGADRQVGRGQRLGADQDIRLDVQRLAAPVVAGAPEAADHLVGDQQHVVFAQHGLDLREVAARRQDHAAGAHDRFRPHRGDRVRALGQDHLLQFVGAAGGEFVLGSRRAGRRGRNAASWCG